MNKATALVIGGGPSGLMAAEVLSQSPDLQVNVYDAMPSLGRKFLMAGKSGLNLTHSEALDQFVARYGNGEVARWVYDFSPNALREWAQRLGVKTFVGTSGKIFPVEMKASPLLRAWLKRLDAAGVAVRARYRWNGKLSRRENQWEVEFETPDGIQSAQGEVVILALGGGSWRKLGSDGAWTSWLEKADVKVEALRPANCGFDVSWSDFFKEKFEGQPVKSVVLSFGDFARRGEFVITKNGAEGNLIYAASAPLRDEIERAGKATATLDLAPDWTEAQVLARLSAPRGSRSTAKHLEKTLGLKGVKVGLLREFAPESFADAARLAAAVKRLPFLLNAPRPLDEAISSAGGVSLDELDENLMLKKMAGVFCVGEMLNWEAPTGGYLLTACFASGRRAGFGAQKYLTRISHSSS